MKPTNVRHQVFYFKSVEIKKYLPAPVSCLSRFLRVGMGIYYPIVDIDVGLNRRVSTEFSFEWGR